MKFKANCPKCDTPAPTVRIPKSFYEFLWGGWTCSKCEAKMDRKGNERN